MKRKNRFMKLKNKIKVNITRDFLKFKFNKTKFKQFINRNRLNNVDKKILIDLISKLS